MMVGLVRCAGTSVATVALVLPIWQAIGFGDKRAIS